MTCSCCQKEQYCRCSRERCKNCSHCATHCDCYKFEPAAPAVNMNITRCRGCQAQIKWIKTPKGKSMPQNLDGSPHWATCPDAKRFHKKNRGQQNS